MDIGIVITLLIFLLSIAGPVIEKQLRKAGKVEQAKTLRKITDTISGDEREEKTGPSSADVPSVPEARTDTYVQTVPDTNVPGAAPVTDSGQDDGNMPDVRAKAWTEAMERYIARNKSRAMGPGDVSRMKTVAKSHARTGELPAEKKKLDIDLRKLVIYSEIMKPKF